MTCLWLVFWNHMRGMFALVCCFVEYMSITRALLFQIKIEKHLFCFSLLDKLHLNATSVAHSLSVLQ